MKVVITTPEGEKSDYFFDSESIIIGRGQNCEIVIPDDHISRKHLEIKKFEGMIFLKDLTLSNWVSYNEEKLDKGMDIQYYDFAPLILPGSYKIEVSDEINSEDELDRRPSKKDVDIYRSKLKRVSETRTDITEFDESDDSKEKRKPRKGKKSSRGNKKKEKSEIGTMAIVLIAVVGFIVYQFFLSEKTNTSKVQKLNLRERNAVKKVERKRNTIKRRKKTTSTNFNNLSEKGKAQSQIESPKIEEDMYTKILAIDEKCQTVETKELCKTLFPNLTKSEGLHRVKNIMYVAKNYNLRGAYLLRSGDKFNNSTIAKSTLLKIIAGEGVLLPNFLKMLELNGVNKVVVILFNLKRMKLNIVEKFEVDVSDYRKYNTQTYTQAFSEVVGNQKTSTFDSSFSRVLKEVK